MIKGTRRFNNVHTAFVILLFVSVLNRASQLLKITPDILPPCLNSIKGHIFGRPAAISLPYSLSNWQWFFRWEGGTEINPGTGGMYQVTGTASKQRTLIQYKKLASALPSRQKSSVVSVICIHKLWNTCLSIWRRGSDYHCTHKTTETKETELLG